MVQVATETGALVLAGGIAGLSAAAAALAAWRSLGPATFPRLAEVALDWHVLAFTAALCAIVAAVCGLIPAIVVTRSLRGTLTAGSRSLTAGRREGLARRAFVLIQLGGTAALLVCALLVARGFTRLERVDPGFTPDHALSLQLSLPPARYTDTAAILRSMMTCTRDSQACPAFDPSGAVSLLPLSGLLSTMDVAFPGRPAPPPDEVPQAHFRIAGPNYFAAGGISVVDGREFDTHDGPRTRRVAVVSQAFAGRHFASARAVGGHVQIDQGLPFEIVGVVENVRQSAVTGPITEDLYIPISQMPASPSALMAARMNWVVRTDVDPSQAIRAVRAAVRALDPDVAASSIRTLDEVFSGSIQGQRATMQLFELFGQAALILAAVGIYTLAAFSASARQRELAIRSAFGASPADLLRLLLAAELRPAALGIGAGLLAGRLAAGSIADQLYSVGPSDTATYAAVALVLIALATVAICASAVRARRADPAELFHA